MPAIMECFRHLKDHSIDEDIDEEDCRVIQHLNFVFGNDIKNLSKAVPLMEELLKAKEDLENKLKLEHARDVDDIFRTVYAAEDILERVSSAKNRFGDVSQEIENFAEQHRPMFDTIETPVKAILYEANIKAYRNWITMIQETSSQIEVDMRQGQNKQALLYYEKLKECAELIGKSQCHHLRLYTWKCLRHWHEVLLHSFKMEFETVLKAMKWPFTSSGTSVKKPVPSPDQIQKLKFLTQNLLKLNMPKNSHCDIDEEKGHNKSYHAEPGVMADFTPSILPLQLLFKPLEVRFLYHFSGNKATNSCENPEWYMTQVLNWISSHETFLEADVQSILNQSSIAVNAKVEFMRALVRMVALKLCSDLPEVQKDDDLFCKTIQEALNFDRELKMVYGYPASEPSVIKVLTQPSVVPRWILLERKFALELMDSFMSSDNAWKMQEESEVATCGDQLFMLLQGITDRYKALPQPGHRLQFLELQLDLIDDFRVRVLQMTKTELSDPLNSNYCSILNTVHYVISTLSDWTDLPFFIEMQYFKNQLDRLQEEQLTAALGRSMKLSNSSLMGSSTEQSIAESSHVCNRRGALESFEEAPVAPILVPPLLHREHLAKQDALQYLNADDRGPDESQMTEVTGSVFDEAISLYSHIETEMLNTITRHLMNEVRARSQLYRKEKWFAKGLTDSRENSSLEREITPSFCFILEVLAKYLHTLRDAVISSVFTTLWQSISCHLDQFLYEEVVMQNSFSEEGTIQFEFDITKALYPLFREFSQRADVFFTKVKESLILLRLPRPTAMLLKDTLKISLQEESNLGISPVQALKDHGISHLSPEEADIVLKRRSNVGHA